jgi:hypothetical protein
MYPHQIDSHIPFAPPWGYTGRTALTGGIWPPPESGYVPLTEGDPIMTKAITSAEFLAIYEALDEARKQELVEHGLELLEEQRDERRTEQRI